MEILKRVGALWFIADAIRNNNCPVASRCRIDFPKDIVPYVHSRGWFGEIHELESGDRTELISNRSREPFRHSRIAQNQHLFEAR